MARIFIVLQCQPLPWIIQIIRQKWLTWPAKIWKLNWNFLNKNCLLDQLYLLISHNIVTINWSVMNSFRFEQTNRPESWTLRHRPTPFFHHCFCWWNDARSDTAVNKRLSDVIAVDFELFVDFFFQSFSNPKPSITWLELELLL